MCEPTLTKRPELLQLMTNEFHKKGKKVFVNTEPKRYIKRLTTQQIALLNDPKKVPKKSLTAFIVFGDGYFQRPIGGHFVHIKPHIDSIRPNASFALFYKNEDETIELVFYTRFFCISYGGTISKNDIAVRKQIRKLDGSSSDKPTLDEIFKKMKNIWFVRKPAFSPASKSSPNRFGIRIIKINHDKFGANDKNRQNQYLWSYIPYMWIVEKRGGTWRAARFMKGNIFSTIHGGIPTKGCWMLGRNYLWSWPDENSNYKDFMNCYLKYERKEDRTLSCLSQPPLNGLGVTKDDFEFNCWNPIYLEIIRKFVGAHYNCHHEHVQLLPKRKYHAVADLSNTKSAFKTNLLESEDDFWKKEKIRFVKGSLAGQVTDIVGFWPFDKKIDVFPSFSDTVSGGSDYEFVLDNCFQKQNNIKFGKNVFGQVNNKNDPWTYLYLYKSNHFTPDPGDETPFG